MNVGKLGITAEDDDFLPGFGGEMLVSQRVIQMEGKIWMFPKIGVPPKSSILIGFSIINHPFWGIYPYFWETPKCQDRFQQIGCNKTSDLRFGHHIWTSGG